MGEKTKVNDIHERVEKSKQRLEKMCKERLESVKQFVGSHYGTENEQRKNVPINLLELATTIYLRLLAARTPHCLVTTDIAELKAFAADMEVVLNQIPEEIHLGDTIRRAVMEAMFSMGIVKVGVAGIDPRPNFGDEPFVSVVQLDDYFCDMSARNWDEIQYEGNEYWMSAKEIKEAYGVTLAGEDYNGYSSNGVEQAASITNNEPGAALYERVLLRDVYLPYENRMITYAVTSMKVLRDVVWDGPEGSPYIKLWFSEVPGNLLPLPPMFVWRDLHDFANVIYRKIANQAVSRKSVAVFAGGNDEDIARFRDAEDGDAVRYSGASPETVSIGGIDQTSLALFLQNNDLLSRFAGNLDSLGGLSAVSGTAKQDEMIAQSASVRVQAMSECVIDFAKRIFKRLAWYMWTDPYRERKYRRVLFKEYDIGIDKEWTPETRDGDFLDYNFDIAVFSMQDDSPTTRIQKLNEIMQGFVYPMQQQLQMQGAYIDMRTLMDYVSRNSNMPELKDLVKFQQPEAVQPRDSSNLPQPSYMSTKSPWTKRVYERVNRPGKMTEHGKNAALAQMLMGGNVQSAEAAGATGENMM